MQARIDSLQDELRRVLAHQTDAPIPTPCPPCSTGAPATEHPPESQASQGRPVADGIEREPDTVPWLAIVVPTVPRHGKAVLTTTLSSMADAIVGTSFEERVKVIVVNNRPGKHDAFSAAKEKYHGARWIELVDNANPEPEPALKPLAPEFAAKHQEAPTPAVLRQTLDVASALRYAVGKSRYALLYEDDFHLCRGALLAVQHMIDRAHKYAGSPDHWSAIRCSFGLAGIVLQNGADGSHADLDRFRGYLRSHCHRRPPDHLAVEFYARESTEAREHFGERQNFGFRHNILRHDGTVSTLREQSPWAMPGCFTELVEPVIFAVEAWSKADCPDDDMWPCPKGLAEPAVISWREAAA